MNLRHDPTEGFDGIFGGVVFHYVSDSECCVVPYAGLIDYAAQDFRGAQTRLEKNRESQITVGPSDRPFAVGLLWHLPTEGPRPKPTITLTYGNKSSSIGPPTADCRWKAVSVLRCLHLIVVTDLSAREREEFALESNHELGWISVKEYVGGMTNSLCFDIHPEEWHRPLTCDELDSFVRHIASHTENCR